MKAAICDDDKKILKYMSETIETVFEKHKRVVELYSFNDSRIFMDTIRNEYYEVIFLDIDMPEFTGFDISRELQKTTAKSTIIFISNKEESVYESIQYQPFRFVRKSHFKQEIEQVIKDLLEEPAFSNNTISIAISNQIIHFDVHKIMYIECHDKILHVISSTTTLHIRYKLTDMEEQLKEYGFIRIHKGCLVNYKYINSIQKSCEVVLENGERLPVSRRRIKEVYDEFGRLVTS